MPKKVKLEDGSEIEIPTEEELKELNEKAAKSSELEKTVEELKADDGNRNWSAIRKTIDRQKSALKNAGIEIDDEGNVKQGEKSFTKEEVEKMVQDSTNKALLNQHINSALRGLDENKRKVVISNYEKLSAGEEISIENVEGFLTSALSASGVQPQGNGLSQVIGGSTPFARDFAGSGSGEKSFTETEAGQGMAKTLGLDLEESK